MTYPRRRGGVSTTMATATVTRTVIPADRAAAGKMRCRFCCQFAKAGGPNFIMERVGSFIQTIHDGPCPQSSGWGDGHPKAVAR